MFSTTTLKRSALLSAVALLSVVSIANAFHFTSDVVERDNSTALETRDNNQQSAAASSLSLVSTTDHIYLAQSEHVQKYLAIWQDHIGCVYESRTLFSNTSTLIVRYYPLDTCMYAGDSKYNDASYINSPKVWAYRQFFTSGSVLYARHFTDPFCSGSSTALSVDNMNSCSATAIQTYTTTTTILTTGTSAPTNVVNYPSATFNGDYKNWLFSENFNKYIAVLPPALTSYPNYTGWSGTMLARVIQDAKTKNFLAVDYTADYMNDNVDFKECPSQEDCYSTDWVKWTDDQAVYAQQYESFTSQIVTYSGPSETYVVTNFRASNFHSPFVILFPTVTSIVDFTTYIGVTTTETFYTTYTTTVWAATNVVKATTTFTGRYVASTVRTVGATETSVVPKKATVTETLTSTNLKVVVATVSTTEVYALTVSTSYPVSVVDVTTVSSSVPTFYTTVIGTTKVVVNPETSTTVATEETTSVATSVITSVPISTGVTVSTVYETSVTVTSPTTVATATVTTSVSSTSSAASGGGLGTGTIVAISTVGGVAAVGAAAAAFYFMNGSSAIAGAASAPQAFTGNQHVSNPLYASDPAQHANPIYDFAS